MPEKVVVIPTYNERDNIERLLPELLQSDPEIEVLVVDDQSPDGTADAVEELGRKLGRGPRAAPRSEAGHRPAYRAGFKRALELGAEYIVQMDADFSHPIASLPDFFDNAKREYDVVLGSRYIDGITVVNWPIERLLHQLLRQRLRAHAHRPAGPRHDRRLQVLAARGARGDRPR